MHIHILGICGTFMGSLACLAKELGHRVTGSDQNVYPPMSTQLEQLGIELISGYDPSQLDPAPDLVVIGNALSRGNPAVEAVLERGLPYTSGPEWLRQHVLPGKWVLAVSGTHGKTTTASMLAWILEYAQMSPGFLIGGVTQNFPVSARLGDTPFFVIEADEYDSAFFDKRSKFVHYQPRTLIINNMEFDHADIFDALADIQRQFHHLVRTVPASGRIIYPANVAAIEDTIAKGCWSETVTTGEQGEWQCTNLQADGSQFAVCQGGQQHAVVDWGLSGQHNVDNALAAILAARHVGVTPEIAAAALSEFKGVKRRMECIADTHSIKVYDDFAHHPTAIQTTLAGLRAKVGDGKIIAVIEPRSNTMRMGVHKDNLAAACVDADDVLWYQPPDTDWDLADVIKHSPVPAKLYRDLNAIIHDALALAEANCHIVIMSNGGFGGLHGRLVEQLNKHAL
ncbi:UDP-N-acetylmuramate:L-alanyl-gamma-D-glutamyl-meso-diaminopimelate ligase [Gilvimarinus sp. SDUM040013]|uniref:UDP-N-acetylmuramate--L-alanyl-gamma-D-glutamyl-meso-2,6-diaminoheptandioate ligase n=1 Tax=Gilvimarinus gilvus TaxID=3058038 RepID=A0ABU4RX75_9GAMM|nr:UDP-N-acetylmuramate:L-alanyl-gamma-D-glutamyl-meso-diaminopimelate ligase [Gilvimarinus sp. SDUM040013]MDO3386812.1 UDP-N-acetylmuramate:L-alanyl-gamma-D-glutamyl-meso-diaminopimelate ligase [Gilvimarinus sp. SDUM040013]MDX6848258.1 UDP-N-acetylmuramate:L-alanyl-gamma-D-glutamyl-meso-diaminopimelate ligase [Gilvimarinus sp. SDUM040013]